MDANQQFINRELSWLEFNARVLEEAQDASKPPLERLKFLAIFSSNLDEFFMIRISGLRNRDPHEVYSNESGDQSTTGEVLRASSARVHEMVAEQYRVLRQEVLPELAKAGLRLLKPGELEADEVKALNVKFQRDIQAVLTPMVIDPAHPFPHIQNRQLYLAAMLKGKGGSGRLRTPKTALAVVPIPALLPRFIAVSQGEGKDHFVALEDVVALNLEQLFAGFEVQERTVLRLTRDQDFELSDQDSEDLVKQIQSELSKRKRGEEVRLEIGMGASERLRKELTKWLDLEAEEIYGIDGPLNLSAFWAWVGLPGYAALRESARAPQMAPRVRQAKGDLFSLIRQGDLMLHHPYESFDTVVGFLEQAATDPDVLAVKQTLYRAGRNSPIVAALARAAERDKQVTALIELKARFDEEANIEWARTLEKAGAHVVYGVPGLKTHCKVSLVVRRDPDRIRRYLHLSTGNYNVATAKVYTDIGIMTCDDRLGEDAAALFNLMTGYAQPPKWHKLRAAPHGLREWVIDLIDREAEHRKAGRPARLVAKLNALVDKDVIQALYRASATGLPIDLIVRGICCLRPGLPGLSETISVRSIIGRYLEHSRVVYVENGGEPEAYLTSADWMPRNFDRRVEVAYPVEDPVLKRRLVDEILAVTMLDDANARVLHGDGTYTRKKGTFNSHHGFEELAAGSGRTFELPKSPVAAPAPKAEPRPESKPEAKITTRAVVR